MIFGKNINRYYLKYWYLFLIGIVSIIVVDYFGSILPPKIIGGIIDHIDEKTLTKEILVSEVSKFFLIMAISFVSRFLWRIGFLSTGHKTAQDLRHRMFKNSLTLSQTFYSDNKVGGLMSYYINDIGSIRESFAWGTMETCDALCLIPMVLFNMFKINWVVSLIIIAPLAMIAISAALVEKFMEDRYDKRQKSFEKLSDFTQESISGIRVIKAFVRERKEMKEFLRQNKNNEEINMNYLRLSVLFNNLTEFFIWLIYFIIIVLGSYFVLVKPNISVGELTELVAYFDTLLWPMFAIGEIINLRSRGMASLKRVDVLLDANTDLIDGDVELNDENFKGSISFNNLSFKYPDSKELYALNNVSFEINPGEFIGVIGKTGSSKTTLVNLLLRLYNVDKGQIFIDGVDIMDIKIDSLRGKIGYVPQDNFLYSSTIESNIAFSSEIIEKEKVEKEARIAGVHSDIVDFPKGYETKLGERGVSVSGGQKQRISIARALYKEPSILILDDALSAVDTKTESEILHFLKEERKGKTTILIAHRISSIKDADKILVLDLGGTVSGFDTHENLLLNNESYKETYNLQKLEAEGGISHA